MDGVRDGDKNGASRDRAGHRAWRVLLKARMGWKERQDGLEGGGVRVAGANGNALLDWTVMREGAMTQSAEREPTMPVAEWQAGEGRRSQRWRGAERPSHGGAKAVSGCRHRQAKRGAARRDGGDGSARGARGSRGAKRHTWHNTKGADPRRCRGRPLSGGRERRAPRIRRRRRRRCRAGWSRRRSGRLRRRGRRW